MSEQSRISDERLSDMHLCIDEDIAPEFPMFAGHLHSALHELAALRRRVLQPYLVQSFWSPCRKYIASVCISTEQITLLDDNGTVWEPTGPSQEINKVTP